jgi:hypothetical protein
MTRLSIINAKIKSVRDKLERDEAKLVLRASECYRLITVLREKAGFDLIDLYRDKVIEARDRYERGDRIKGRKISKIEAKKKK